MSVVVYEGIKIVASASDRKVVIHVHEASSSLRINLSVRSIGPVAEGLVTSEEARELAKQLYRLAKRLDDRLIAKEQLSAAPQPTLTEGA